MSYGALANANTGDAVDTEATPSDPVVPANEEIDETFSFAFPRRIIRNSSFILAETGERLRRTLTTTSEITNLGHFNENSALLPDYTYRNTDGGLKGWITEKERQIISHISNSYNDANKSVLKCSLAYLIASLGVYCSPLSEILGRSDSKHVVATVAVYFHPSRTKGSMHQTLVFVIVSVAFSFSISLLCRLASTFFFQRGESEISYGIDLVVSAIALAIVAYMKQRIGKPTFNTACSLATISIVSCVVKEGSLNAAAVPYERLQSIFYIVCIGCFISVTMCYILWPTSAVDDLKRNLNDSHKSMSTILSVLSSKYFSGGNSSTNDVNDLISKLKKNISSLNNSLEESKYELKLLGKEAEFEAFEKLVLSTKSLYRHLLGLRSSAEMQWKLLHEDDITSASSLSSLRSFSSSSFQISPSVEDLSRVKMASINSNDDYVVKPSQLFDLFVYYLAPSTKSFIFTIKSVLKQIPIDNEAESPVVYTKIFQESLLKATELYNEHQTEAFKRLYKQKIFKNSYAAEYNFRADQEEVAANCGNFASLLGQFSKELINFLNLLEQYPYSKLQPRTFGWLKFWNWSFRSKRRNETTLDQALAQYQNTIRVESQSWNFRLWKLLKVFRSTDFQFTVRVGLGGFCISLLAFLPQTKMKFSEWRGEWSLVIYSIMMNKSLGGTSMTVKWRFIGTFLGAASAYSVWKLFEGNVYALAISGFLISIPSFNIILHWKTSNAYGRFILLTYNLTALYSYSMTQKDDEDGNEGGDNPIIAEIAFHRFAAVTLGAVWALLMASVFLPNSARSRLKRGLTVLWLRMGLIWNSDPLFSTFKPETQEVELTGLKDQRAIHEIMTELELLLKQAPKELRLKGKFPVKIYEKLLKSTSSIIDAFQNMSAMIDVNRKLTDSEDYVLKFIAAERSELEHRIFLMFYMISSAMILGFPLPSKPASTEHAKDRMLAKLNGIRLRSDEEKTRLLTNEDYVLLYSYILVTSTITDELDKITDQIRELLGNLSAETFELT